MRWLFVSCDLPFPPPAQGPSCLLAECSLAAVPAIAGGSGVLRMSAASAFRTGLDCHGQASWPRFSPQPRLQDMIQPDVIQPWNQENQRWGLLCWLQMKKGGGPDHTAKGAARCSQASRMTEVQSVLYIVARKARRHHPVSPVSTLNHDNPPSAKALGKPPISNRILPIAASSATQHFCSVGAATPGRSEAPVG